MALRFGFEAQTRRFGVFFLTFNMLVNKQSGFLALGFLTGVDAIGTFGFFLLLPLEYTP